jgi:hypothetical protein
VKVAQQDVEASYKKIVQAVGVALKVHGYRKSGARFRLDRVGNLALIAFQRSTTSDAETIRFTMNIGIVSGELLRRWDPDQDLAKVPVQNAHLWIRLGDFLPDPRDHWWEVNSSSDIGPLEAELVAVLEPKVVPFLDAHLSDAALLELWKTGRSPGLTDGQRIRNITELEHALVAR